MTEPRYENDEPVSAERYRRLLSEVERAMKRIAELEAELERARS